MPYIEHEGSQLFWTEKGSGPPILLIMGLSFTHEMWHRTLPALTGYRAILFDNRGMGRSSVPRGPYSVRQMARDANAVLTAANVASAHVIGASMGGMIAQELALLYPQRVRSLILACTSYSGLFARWPDLRCGPRWIRWRESTREQREQSWRGLLYSNTTPAARIEEDIRIRCACAWNQKGFFNQFAGILMWNSYWRLPRISAPTLVIHGDQDRLIPPQNGRTVARRIRGARFQVIPNAGHIIMTDQPELCRDVLVNFLAEQDAPLSATGS
jgi:pimeloyl-ACP methyl ester carboxylesterase